MTGKTPLEKKASVAGVRLLLRPAAAERFDSYETCQREGGGWDEGYIG